MPALLTVFVKEFLENLRDRRTLMSALLFGPLFGPILFGAMVSRMLNQSAVESDQPLCLTLAGREQAPGLVEYLQSQGVELKFAPLSESAAREAVRARPRSAPCACWRATAAASRSCVCRSED